MSDHWLYSQQLPSGPADWTLQGPEAQHARVKRLQAGEAIHLFDGRGRVATAEFLACDRKTLRARITDVHSVSPPAPHVTVAVSQPRGERLDWMLEKLTELGVAGIWPLACERSIANARQDRIERWHRRTVEAAKQAHVAWLPAIEASQGLSQVLGRGNEFTNMLFADTTSPAIPILTARHPEDRRLLVLIGPEGGFSDAERALIAHAGLQRVNLGATILRTETAAIVAAACLLAPGGTTTQPQPGGSATS